MSIVTQILREMPGVSGPQRNFITHLMELWLCVRGRFNFCNLGRYSSYHERTLRRQFEQSFDWGQFNSQLLKQTTPNPNSCMLAFDHSFVPKSGKKTPGRDWFYNGCAGRSEKGLELSLVAVVNLDQNTAYALHAKQTLPAPQWAELQLKQQTTDQTTDQTTEPACQALRHLQESQCYWPENVKYLAVDGAFTRAPFVRGVCALGLEVVGKLRCDAHVRFLYEGEQNPRGRRKLYDGKVRWKQFDASRWCDEGELEAGVRLYSAVLNHPRLGRNIKVAMLRISRGKDKGKGKGKDKGKDKDKDKDKEPRQVLLWSSDVEIGAHELVRLYRARFQIEFLLRDAKSGAGLTQCQSRKPEVLAFHWNAAFAAINVAKAQRKNPQPTRFSWASLQQKQANLQLLQLFSWQLQLDWDVVKLHSNFQTMCNYGVIAA